MDGAKSVEHVLASSAKEEEFQFEEFSFASN